MPRKSSKKKAAAEPVLPPAVEVEKKVETPVEAAPKVEEEDDVAWVRKQLSAAPKPKVDDDIRDAINDPDSEFKFMPPDTNRSTASLAMVKAEEEAAATPAAKRGRKPKVAPEPEKVPEKVTVSAAPVVVVAAAPPAAKPAPQPAGKPAWLLAQEKAQAARTETVIAKPSVKATDSGGGAAESKKVDAPSTLRIKTAPPPPAAKPAKAEGKPEVKAVASIIEITPARVDMAVGKEHTSRMLPNQQVVTRIFSGIYNAEPCDSDVNGMF